MRGRSKTLDLRVSWKTDGTYRLPGSCVNCGWEGTLLLSRGSEAPRHFPTYNAAQCEKCGCKTVGRKRPVTPSA